MYQHFEYLRRQYIIFCPRVKGSQVLKINEDIIIMGPADKGSAIAIMNKDDYAREGYRQLTNTNFYEETNEDLTFEVNQRVNLRVHNKEQRGRITEKTCHYHINDINKTQHLYRLPRIMNSYTIPQADPLSRHRETH